MIKLYVQILFQSSMFSISSNKIQRLKKLGYVILPQIPIKYLIVTTTEFKTFPRQFTGL